MRKQNERISMVNFQFRKWKHTIFEIIQWSALVNCILLTIRKILTFTDQQKCKFIYLLSTKFFSWQMLFVSYLHPIRIIVNYIVHQKFHSCIRRLSCGRIVLTRPASRRFYRSTFWTTAHLWNPFYLSCFYNICFT